MNLSTDNPTLYNEAFLDMLEKNASGIQEGIRQYIHTEVLEGSFARSILTPVPITISDCQVNISDNSLYVVRDIEPDTEAVSVDNLGQPDGRYVKGSRYIIPIVNLVTDRFQITEDDLKAYKYKITKRIQDKSVPILHKLEDKFFSRLAGAALSNAALTGKKIVAGNETTDNLTLKEQDFTKLTNTLSSGISSEDEKKLELGCILMTQEDYNTAVHLPGAGDDFGKDRVYNGLSTDTLFGYRIIKTIKSNIIPRGHLWAFTTEDALGHAFTLGETKFEIHSKFGLIEWQTKMSVGYGIGNARGVGALTLKGSTGHTQTDGTIETAFSNHYSGLEL